MHAPHPMGALSRIVPVTLLLGIVMLTSACGGDSHIQQQASQNQTQFDHLLQHAQMIGVPATLLTPLTTQEQALNNTSAPFTLSNDQPVTNYYRNLATRYAQLQIQLQGLIASSTEQLQTQAQQDMQNFQLSLTQQRLHGLPVQSFALQFSQYQAMMSVAQYPKDYSLISSNAHTAMQALDWMQLASARMTTLKNTIKLMQNAHLDITVIQLQYQHDQQLFTSALKPTDFQRLSSMIDAQYQQAVVNTTQALPIVGPAKLSELEVEVGLLKAYGVDASAYQKKLDADRSAMSRVVDISSYAQFSQQVDADIVSMRRDFLQGQANYLVKQFHQEVDGWDKSHPYYDQYDGQYYPLDAGYKQAGIGSDLDLHLTWAYTPDDFQSIIDEADGALFNLYMMETDYNDPTPYNKVHTTDLQMLEHYKLEKGQVLIVSLVEQAMRVYQDGKLVNAFQVTTGRTELPSLPGVWSVLGRQSPTIFKSIEPKGSPYWYPDTPINYAIMYHQGGYYIHDSWWRTNYGPGTQFPHFDFGGDQAFAGNGSHGCVNMQESQAAWVYYNTNWNTKIAIY